MGDNVQLLPIKNEIYGDGETDFETKEHWARSTNKTNDVDLIHITPRLIAMAKPASGRFTRLKGTDPKCKNKFNQIKDYLDAMLDDPASGSCDTPAIYRGRFKQFLVVNLRAEKPFYGA